jgi:hypothetical protein
MKCRSKALGLCTKIATLLMLIITILVSIYGCNGVNAGASVRINGTWDLVSPMERNIIPAYPGSADQAVQASFSATSVEDVKNGRADMAILGREPTAAELSGLKDYVIAYDAVCLLIDQNSFEGGENPGLSKAEGFQSVTKKELTDILSYWTLPWGFRWWWEGKYFKWGPTLDLNTMAQSGAPGWLPKPILMTMQLRLLPGKYDTQTVLYQAVGLNDTQVAKLWGNNFSYTDKDAEEEYLAMSYKNIDSFSAGGGDFAYLLTFASRRVTQIAMQHIPVKVVAIDGVDPLANPESVYDGTYPLARKIHLLLPQNGSQAANSFKDYLLSPAGQKALTEIGYLPLPQ